jgi:hypothetical protein
MNTPKYALNFTAMVSSQNMPDIQVILHEKAANALVSSATISQEGLSDIKPEETAIARQWHAKHVMTSLNKELLLSNDQ